MAPSQTFPSTNAESAATCRTSFEYDFYHYSSTILPGAVNLLINTSLRKRLHRLRA